MLRFALLLFLAWAAPVAAFGAGNIASISKVEGKNWRHGDIEDVLLSLAAAHAFNKGKNFSTMMIKQTYLGNWCRDYSQAIDVGTVKSVSAEAIRLLLCVLGFMTFGYGSGEFEITAERLGCYRPEEHIDNPKNYADNEDARRYDRRLRAPVDEEVELAIDMETGMKNYIANEGVGIMTSAKLIRQLFGRSIELGRRYKERGNKRDMHESLRLLGTGLHCLEDFFAHSNYCELALIELGERDIFPHVGRDTEISLEGARDRVYPITTGTFGGVDFLHSVTGEVSDKLTQNEIDELEGTLEHASTADTSMLRDLLDKIPDGFFGDKHESDKIDELQQNAANAQMENMSVSPREPEEFTLYIQNVFRQVQPAIEFHDEVMKSITSAIENIPVLPKVVEQLEEELSRFVFSLIAPYVVPLIQNIKGELMTGSAEIISSSENEQHIVFHDDNSTDPTHSMLSKDHFSNVLNEIAGQCAAKMVHWAVPQLMKAIDDDGIDVDQVVGRIISGVLYHPAQRDMGERGAREGRQGIFRSVEEWWHEMPDRQREEYRRKLSRDGVERGDNHKDGVYDTGHGHGCAGQLKMKKLYGGPQTTEDKIASFAAEAIIEGVTSSFGGGSGGGGGGKSGDAGGLIGSLLGAFGGGDQKSDEGGEKRPKKKHDESGYGGQSEHRRTEESSYDSGRRHEGGQQSSGSYGGGEAASYSQGYGSSGRNESSYGEGQRYGGESDSYQRQEESSYGGGGGGYGGESDSYQRQEHSGYGGGRGGESDSYRRQEESHHGGDSYGSREETSYGGDSYGRREETSYGGDSYGRREETSYGGDSYGRREESGHSGGSYGRREETSYGGDSYGQREERGYGEEHGGESREHRRKKSDDSDDSKKKHHRRKKSGDSEDSDEEKKQRRREEGGGYGGGGGGYGGGESYGGGDGGYGGGGGYSQEYSQRGDDDGGRRYY